MVRTFFDFLAILSSFVYLKILKRIDRVQSTTAYSDLQFLFWAAKEGGGKGAIVEIGAYKGKSTVALGLGTSLAHREKVVSIDPHEEGIKDLYFKNLVLFGVNDYVQHINSTSEEAARQFCQEVRLIFIDGDHAYEAVKKDILAWKDFVVEGGLIAFHDYYFPPVSKAIEELISSSGEFILECEIGCTGIFSKRRSQNSLLIERARLFNRLKRLLFPWRKALR